MYEQAPFKIEDRATLFGVIRANPLGLLITAGAGGLMANAIPFILKERGGDAPLLQAHVARANAQWKEIVAGAETLVVFQGVEQYVTPSWYPAKQEHGKVVPTWNYVIVQAKGPTRTIQDGGWLVAHVAELSDRHEAQRDTPWSVDDAPDGFIAALSRGIVGIEIEAKELNGKFKLSQNRSEADRRGVAEGLAGADDVSASPRTIARRASTTRFSIRSRPVCS
jgi:transcriptional regulator